jgi:hypothetical protein
VPTMPRSKNKKKERFPSNNKKTDSLGELFSLSTRQGSFVVAGAPNGTFLRRSFMEFAVSNLDSRDTINLYKERYENLRKRCKNNDKK